MKRRFSLILFFLVILCTLGLLTKVALAQDPDPVFVAPVRAIYEAFASGQYALMGALLVILLVAFTKKWFGDRIVWLHTDAGGSAMALIGATATAIATGLALPGTVLTLSLLRTSLLVGVTAAGGYTILKNLLVNPILRPLAARAPAWAQPIFQAVLWIFVKPITVVPTVQLPTAIVAGTAAVPAVGSPGASAARGALDTK